MHVDLPPDDFLRTKRIAPLFIASAASKLEEASIPTTMFAAPANILAGNPLQRLPLPD